MSDLLSIGRSALLTTTRALDVVGSNVANAKNPDYVRRVLNITDTTIYAANNPIYNNAGGTGSVTSNGITRSSDQFLESATRQTGANRVSAEVVVQWLNQGEIALTNNDTDLGTQLTKLFGTAEELSAVPFEPALRNQFVGDIETTVERFNQTALNLSSNVNLINGAASQEVDELNTALNELAQINQKLLPAELGSAQHTVLLDMRDAALTVITEKLDVEISFGAKGTADISRNGTNLVAYNVASPVTFVAGAGASFDIEIGSVVQAAPNNGTLGGLQRAQSNLINLNNDLDSLAVQFAAEINGWQANGWTDAGVPGTAIISHAGTAASLSTTGLSADSLALAAPFGAANGNILAFVDLRTATGTEQGFEKIALGQAQTLLAARSESAASTAFDQATREARDNIATVDLDREAADLIRLQQSYEAAARIVQVAKETTQTILGIF